ncbi:MAG: CoA pyrophosphatase [Phototrophicaceae bacterium]
MLVTIQHVKQSLKLSNFDSFQAQMGMSPSGREQMLPKRDNPPRQSAVLVLICETPTDDLQLILTKRTDHLRGHSGQVSFPGGSCDADDPSYEHTALRETCEEIAVCDTSHIQLLGRLSKMWIPPSNFEVVPVVASMAYKPEMNPSPDEVAQILTLSLTTLLDEKTKKTTPMKFRGTTFDVPYYDVAGQIVWGATAAMLSELEHRLKVVLSA